MSKDLHAIVQRMLQLEEQELDISTEKDTLWNSFGAIADDAVGEGASYRYLDMELEQYIARIVAKPKPRIKLEELEAALTHEQWVAITDQTRVFNPDKLQAMIDKGEIDKELVQEHTEQPPLQVRKNFGQATKADREKIAAAAAAST